MNKDILIIVGFLFGVLLGVAIMKSCSPQEAEAATPQEWRCKASPPDGTKFKDAIEIISYHEDKQQAEKNAIWLCNKMFKTDKCKIDNCKLVGR